jgi:hypothetical protein
MSNALAIATVTETLLHLLNRHVERAVSGATVTALPPDAPAGLPNPGVNIFLYQISPNAALRNADLPTRAADGSLLRRPQAALDLHYLLTFYGDPTQLDQQRLLGAVTLALHAHPELPRDLIQHVETTTPFLMGGAGLAEQSEAVRFVPVNFSLEELSKLWSFLLKIDYVLSTAYRASVVLIETDDPLPPPAPKVLTSVFQVLPFQEPIITQVLPAPGSGPLILPGSQILLVGRNLAAQSSGSAGVQVLFGQTAQSPDQITPTTITVTLPGGIAAGMQSVRVQQQLMLGSPPVPHRAGIQSAIAAFVLHPVIQAGSPPDSFAVTADANFGSPPGQVIIVGLTPAVRGGQNAAIQLIGLAQPPVTLVFSANPITADTDTIIFPVPGLPPGSYLVRVLIDSADSPFVLSPSGGPIAPTVTV